VFSVFSKGNFGSHRFDPSSGHHHHYTPLHIRSVGPLEPRQNETAESGPLPVTQQFPDRNVCQCGLASASSLKIDDLRQVEIVNENIAQVITGKTDYPRAVPRPKCSQAFRTKTRVAYIQPSGPSRFRSHLSSEGLKFAVAGQGRLLRSQEKQFTVPRNSCGAPKKQLF
jgi:hypothetical protein